MQRENARLRAKVEQLRLAQVELKATVEQLRSQPPVPSTTPPQPRGQQQPNAQVPPPHGQHASGAHVPPPLGQHQPNAQVPPPHCHASGEHVPPPLGQQQPDAGVPLTRDQQQRYQQPGAYGVPPPDRQQQAESGQVPNVSGLPHHPMLSLMWQNQLLQMQLADQTEFENDFRLRQAVRRERDRTQLALLMASYGVLPGQKLPTTKDQPDDF